MKVIVLGASGIIGGEIVKALEPKHEIVRAGARSGDVRVDYTDAGSVRALFDEVGPFDALAVAVGRDTLFKPYEQLTDADFEYGFQRKFMAQINLVRLGTAKANDGASFTLSSGFLSHFPNPASVATGTFNAAVDAFARSAAPLLPRGLRVNVVSPAPVVPESELGQGLVTAQQTAAAYVESIEGSQTGHIFRVWGGLEKNFQGDEVNR